MDRDCTNAFPIQFPGAEDRIVHKVVVARGAAEACKEYLSHGSGSLIIKPRVVAEQHWSGKIEPFVIGDVDPTGSFIHVLDDVTLDVILGEMDTIRDFVDYLTKKAAFIRSGNLREAHGEENLLAYYAIRTNSDGDHDFVTDPRTDHPLVIDRSHYGRLFGDPRYIAKKQADKISYLWDTLITEFTNHMLDGTSITLEGYDFNLKRNEVGVRHMALQRRLLRRNFGEGIKGALEIGKTQEVFFRAMMSPVGSKENETAFFIHTLKYLDWMEQDGGYERYRHLRSNYALVYAKGLLERHPHVKRTIGISCEPPSQGHGGSEDLVYVEQAEWTDEDRRAIKADCKKFGVLQDPKETQWHAEEYPDFENHNGRIF